MKLNIKLWLLPLLSVVLTVGCTEDDSPGIGVGEGETYDLHLYVNTPPAHRSSDIADEDRIDDLLVLLFEPDTDSPAQPGKLWRAAKGVEGGTGDTYRRYDIRISAPESSIPDQLTVVAVANGCRWFDAMTAAAAEGLGYEECRRLLLTDTDARRRLADATPSGSYFTYWGRTAANIDLKAENSTLSLRLIRDMPRVNVSLSAQEASKGTRLAAMMLYNANTSLSPLPAMDNISSDGQTVVSPTVTEAISGGVEPALPEYAAAGVEIHYDFAEQKCSTPNYALLVAAYLGNEPDKPYWYRVDFKDGDGNLIDLLRNHSYNINVTGVKGRGSDTPQEAYDSNAFDIEIQLVEWDDVDSDVLFDEDKWVAVPRQVTLGPSAGAEASLTVATNVEPSEVRCVWNDGAGSSRFVAVLETGPDGGLELTVKALASLDDDVDAVAETLTLRLTPRLQAVVNVVQRRMPMSIPKPWDSEDVELNY